MPFVAASGLNSALMAEHLENSIRNTSPKVLGLAVAYASKIGIHTVLDMCERNDVEAIKLVTDVRDAVTHPSALKMAMNAGCEIKGVKSSQGTFHPKLYVGGGYFDEHGRIHDSRFAIVSSANLSKGGFQKNGEVSAIFDSDDCNSIANHTWFECWQCGVPFGPSEISQYENYFADRNRFRRTEDMQAFGIFDENVDEPLVSEYIASIAWAGLESFTGDYNFQLEFPKKAGQVLRRVLNSSPHGNKVQMLCDDFNMYEFQYSYYEQNGMFRLNIPNDVPGISWARQYRTGIACVELDANTGGLKFYVLKPSNELNEIVQRSKLLGSWGQTPTRLYGWL